MTVADGVRRYRADRCASSVVILPGISSYFRGTHDFWYDLHKIMNARSIGLASVQVGKGFVISTWNFFSLNGQTGYLKLFPL